MNLKDLIQKELVSFTDEQDGFRKFPRAKFAFSRERAEEFSRVSIETILDDKYFLGLKWNGNQGLYPALKDVLIELYEERKKRIITTFIFTGGIGLGKSVVSNIITYIELFQLIIMPDHCSYYGLTSGTNVCFIMLSRDENKAKRVTFRKFLPIIYNSKVFQDYFPPQIDMEKMSDNPRTFPSDLRFPKGLVVFPGTGHAASILGFDVFGATVDEANDLQVVEHSKKNVIKSEYDAAGEAYNEILGRMDSRFPYESLHRQGKKHGICCLIGQTRGPDSFLERKIREAEMLGDASHIFYVRKARWESQPRERFSKEEFIFDITQGRIVEFISKEERDLSENKCEICNTLLKHGAYIGNNGKLVCCLDCYEETFFGKSEIVKEKSSGL